MDEELKKEGKGSAKRARRGKGGENPRKILPTRKKEERGKTKK